MRPEKRELRLLLSISRGSTGAIVVKTMFAEKPRKRKRKCSHREMSISGLTDKFNDLIVSIKISQLHKVNDHIIYRLSVYRIKSI